MSLEFSSRMCNGFAALGVFNVPSFAVFVIHFAMSSVVVPG